ncbi:glycine cleavage system aminomethyltransferase GcvT [Phycicoccus sp. MAQZ13P-2]|uniref:glycine cleavage system aminomethyltransferase GcvT n=1 Tax=Phycicoccus mangrovi TaxID=2840470 RepID=UPI001C002B6D|nr:glycine cleavage system aminomethyltransferase GcvT [Phycicoccus mangrovi]MBT9257206.1 glycine cleavage system aminomethyltransferase GcvT [Phycicoccus mangrovi]MBT9276143.1 glycine cleavage system aminomethyltransferase GcvT [Phycicoccus mangrovi]
MSKPTALHAVHHAAGAHFTDFADWQMPLRYGSELSEHRAVRTAAGLFDLSHMGEIEVVGPHAAALLDHALVGDISALAVAKARYTMICNEDGGILDDLIVYRLAGERYMVVANASNAAVVLDALRQRACGFDAEVQDRCDDWSLIAVQGPSSSTILGGLTDADLGALRYYAIQEASVAGRPVRLARTGYTGEDGFEIFCDPADAVGIWEALSEAGAPHGLVPAGLACRDSLRLEAGMPLYGNELRADLTPYEAGLGRVVKLEKPGDFVGRAALEERVDHEITRVRVGLRPDGRRAPRSGYTVLDPASGSPVGFVTSGAPSPTLGHPIAMAYVDTALSEPGTRLLVDVRGQQVAADVVSLPFYSRPR